jgi:tetratricopeptide (TPR) repeat protein
LKPDYADAWKNLGSCYGTIKDYDHAIAAFQKALSFAPADADIKRFLEMTVNLKNAAMNH